MGLKKLATGTVTTGAGALAYTVPTGMECNVVDIVICNGSANQAGIHIHFVPSGGTKGVSNTFLAHYHVASHDVYHWTGNQKLNTGDFIYVISDQSDVVMHITGDETR